MLGRCCKKHRVRLDRIGGGNNLEVVNGNSLQKRQPMTDELWDCQDTVRCHEPVTEP